MRALVVYESMFGNTRDLAQALTHGIAKRMDVTLLEVGSAPSSIGPEVGLLVTGAPTHAFSLSRPSTREDAARQAANGLVSQGFGLREWIASLTPSAQMAAATFDTHMGPGIVSGSASKSAARRLRQRGFRIIDRTSFSVSGFQGPLADGESARADAWGEQLAGAVLEHTALPQRRH